MGERELLAIIFTDAVDSTARTASDEDHSLRILLGDLDHIRNEAAVRGGAVLKNTGDGLLISFKSAVDAVECALAIQRGFANRPANTSFHHKVGVHIGDVIKKDGDIYGSGVNTASRLVAQCPSGGVCLSSTVYELVKQKSQLGSLRVENFQLTNIEPPIGAYRIRPSSDQAVGPASRARFPKVRGRIAWGLATVPLLTAGWLAVKLWPTRGDKDSAPIRPPGPVAMAQATAKDWVPGADPEAVASVYFKIWNLEMGEDYVLNSYNANEGRGKCLLFLNEGFKNQSGQLWDLRHLGSLRNSFLGKDREISIDLIEGTAFMGVAGSPQGKVKMVLNPDGGSFKIMVADRYLTAEPGRPGGNPRVWASRTDRGRKSDWALRPSSLPLPGLAESNSARKKTLPVLSPEVDQRLQALRERDRNNLAERLEEKISKAWETTKRFPGSRVVVGQVKLADNRKDVRLVDAQVEILEEGFFAGEVRDLQSPIGFALQGYLPNQIQPVEKKGEVVDVGEITLQPLSPLDGASLTLKVEGNEDSRSYTSIKIFVEEGPINTPHNGTSPRGSPGWEPPVEMSLNDKGEASRSGLSPGGYYMSITSPKTVEFQKRFVLTRGTNLDLGVIRLLKKDEASAPSGN